MIDDLAPQLVEHPQPAPEVLGPFVGCELPSAGYSIDTAFSLPQVTRAMRKKSAGPNTSRDLENRVTTFAPVSGTS